MINKTEINCNIFVAHTPFQIYFTTLIITSIKSFEHEFNVLLVEGVPSCDRPELISKWDVIRPIHNVGGTTLGRERKILADQNIEKIVKIIDDIGSANVCIHLSEILWPLNNRIFFDKQLAGRARFAAFMDGLGSYIPLRNELRHTIKNWFKYLVSLLGMASKYRPFGGDQYGYLHERIDAIYAFQPEYMLGSLRKKKFIPVIIPAPHSNLSQKETKVLLFLDQPYRASIRGEKIQGLQDKTIAYLKSLGCTRYLYKPHHHCCPEDQNIFVSAGFELISSELCIEEFIGESDINILASYNCSALFNIKLAYGGGMRCLSLYARERARKLQAIEIETESLVQLFERAGIEIIC